MRISRNCTSSQRRLLSLLNENIAKLPQGQAVKLRGPMPCPISRIAGYFRNQIVMQSPRPEPLQELLKLIRASPIIWRPESVAVDVDPISLL